MSARARNSDAAFGEPNIMLSVSASYRNLDWSFPLFSMLALMLEMSSLSTFIAPDSNSLSAVSSMRLQFSSLTGSYQLSRCDSSPGARFVKNVCS